MLPNQSSNLVRYILDGNFSSLDVGHSETVDACDLSVEGETKRTLVRVGGCQVSTIGQGVVAGFNVVLSMEVLGVVSQYNDEFEFHTLRLALGEEKTVWETTMTDFLVNKIVTGSTDGFVHFLHELLESLAVGDGDRRELTGTTDDVLFCGAIRNKSFKINMMGTV